MPRADRITKPAASGKTKPAATATTPSSTTAVAAAPAEPKKPSWFMAFLVGVGHGFGNAIGSAAGKLLVAALTTGTSYAMYRTRAGYRLACLVYPPERVDTFVERTRLTGRIVVGGTAFIGASYITVKVVRGISYVVRRVSGTSSKGTAALPPPPAARSADDNEPKATVTIHSIPPAPAAPASDAGSGIEEVVSVDGDGSPKIIAME
ncbi:hypothetical protein H9P43_000276 [Blastocladiella emersonii ATCC 22665]|nr:hypothetical protein H9P43_000276 [Blastocladiella emersonii ATCC 22665]